MSWKRRLKKIALYGGLSLALTTAIGLRKPVIEERQIEFSQQIGNTITVMSANIAAGRGRSFDFPADLFPRENDTYKGLHALEELIKAEDIDIACFQEIEHNDIRRENQPLLFAKNTPLQNYAFAQNFSYKFFNLFFLADGNAIHSKTTLFHAGKESFEYRKKLSLSSLIDSVAGSKGILHAEVHYDNIPIHVLCTHFTAWETILGEREIEMKILFEYAAQHTPAIILADLNTVPLHERDKYFYPGVQQYLGERSLYAAQEVIAREHLLVQSPAGLYPFEEQAEQTFPGTSVEPVPEDKLGETIPPDTVLEQKTIDYIFIVQKEEDKLKLTLEETKVVLDKYYSDHAPVIGKIKVEKK